MGIWGGSGLAPIPIGGPLVSINAFLVSHSSLVVSMLVSFLVSVYLG